MNLRTMEANDLAEVAALFDLYRQFYGCSANPALAFTFIRDRFQAGESVVLVAQEAGGPLAGFCQLYPSFCSLEAGPVYVLYDLFVPPSWRKRGVGRMLLHAAEQRALADGMLRLDLTTAHTNLAAQRLYESTGWQRDEVFIAYSLRPRR